MTTRRDTLSWLLRGAAALVFLPAAAVALKFLTPRSRRIRSVVGRASDISLRRQRDAASPWSITRIGETDIAVGLDHAGSPVAFELRCTHANCSVSWHPGERSFLCPCHGGRFDVNGDPIQGPPTAPLKRLKLERQGDNLIVEVDE